MWDCQATQPLRDDKYNRITSLWYEVWGVYILWHLDGVKLANDIIERWEINNRESGWKN